MYQSLSLDAFCVLLSGLLWTIEHNIETCQYYFLHRPYFMYILCVCLGAFMVQCVSAHIYQHASPEFDLQLNRFAFFFSNNAALGSALTHTREFQEIRVIDFMFSMLPLSFVPQ